MKKQANHLSRQKTVEELAELLNCSSEGDGKTEISKVASLDKAQKGDLVFLAHKKHIPLLEKSKASAVIIPQNVQYDRIPVIRSENPHLTFIQAVEVLYEFPSSQPEIHQTAIISPSAKIGKEVTIGAFCYIGEKAEIGDRSIIYPLASVYLGVKIGRNTIIHSHVSLREGIKIGNNVIIHNGAVIGTDGYGYIQQKDKSHAKIPQLGTVIIEDNVEIGANTTIDRASLGETIVKKGTKIDNLVMVGHNVEIGENTILVSQVGISGSVKVGKNVKMAGQVGIADHVTIGDNVILGAQAGVMNDIPPNSVMALTPCINIRDAGRVTVSLYRLPELIKTVKKLEERIEELEKKGIR